MPKSKNDKLQGTLTLLVLRAVMLADLGRDGVVKSIKAKPGDSVAVDAVILEFA